MKKAFSKKIHIKKFSRLFIVLLVGIITLTYSESFVIEGQFNEEKKVEFDIDYIISDEAFTNINSLSMEQIQTFLESENSPLADKEIYQRFYLTHPLNWEIYNLVFPNGKLAREASPAEIIYYSARIQISSKLMLNQINPKVLLALLKLNSGLINRLKSLDQYTLDNALRVHSIEYELYNLNSQGFLNQLIGLASNLTQDFEYFENAPEYNKPTTIVDGIIHYPKNAGTYALQRYLNISAQLLSFNNMNISSFSGDPTASSFRFPLINYIKNDGCLEWKDELSSTECTSGKKLHLADDVCKDAGTDIFAISNGVIKYAQFYKSCPNWGHLIVIEHTLANGNKVCSIYGHCIPTKAPGSIVKKGQHIGSIAHYECWSDHIHFGIYNGSYSDIPCYDDSCFTQGYRCEEDGVSNYIDPIKFVEDHQCAYGSSIGYEPKIRWHPDGTLTRAQGGINVYIIHDGKKKHITNGDFLNKYYYGFEWNNVIDVVPEELDCYPTGEDIVHQPKVVRVSGTDPIYLIFNDTYKKHFNREEVFEGLGYSWNVGPEWYEIKEITQEELNTYSDDPVCPELYSPYPDGTLIRKHGGTDVYVITNGKKRLIKNETVFNMLGYNLNCIVEDTDTAIDKIPEITPPIDSNMIIIDLRINNGK
jgi:hypothetical protein